MANDISNIFVSGPIIQKIDYCRKKPCQQVIPIDKTNLSKKMRQSQIFKRTTTKSTTVNVGKPYKLTTTNITETCVNIDFEVVGTPKYYHVTLKNLSTNTKQSPIFSYSRTLSICDLNPDTEYEINIIVFYDCDKTYEIDFKKVFRTEPLKTVLDISFIDVQNKTIIYNGDNGDNISYVPVQLIFKPPITNPRSYIIDIVDTNNIYNITHTNASEYKIQVMVRNDISTNVRFNTLYDDISYQLQYILSPRNEGPIFNETANYFANYIDLSFSTKGAPEYSIYTNNILKMQSTSDGDNNVLLNELIKNTEYVGQIH